MIEDDIYRTSSQYRYWSYTKESLSRLRQNTNALASERVRAAFRRAQETKTASNGESHDGNANGEDVEIETLTVDEELKIVEWGCQKIMDMGEAMSPRIPSHVVATATQYLRRFYLTNSPMTYHPKSIIACALYLSTKSSHFYLPLSRFVSELSGITEDKVKAPEFLLIQGLRFTLDVRHPMQGLTGGFTEMGILAAAGRLEGLETPAGRELEKRIGAAADRAKALLNREAQLTDAYFLYTPSQIWLAAMLVADAALAEAYLSAKLGALDDDNAAAAAAATGVLRERVLATVRACAGLLATYTHADDSAASRKEMKRIGKKLGVCQNPEKADMVALAAARRGAEKREGGGVVDAEAEAERKAKKRRTEREAMARDGDVFGPSLRDAAA